MATYVKGNAVANATSYTLHELTNGTAGDALDTKDEINFEVSALGLPEGDHTLIVKAHASGYTSSEASNEVVFTVAGSGGTEDGDGEADSGNGITNYSIPYTEWDWKQGLSTSTIGEDSFSISVASGTSVVLGRRMNLADTPFSVGDTVYFGIKDFTKEGGNLSLCFMKSDGTEITPRLNASVTQPITYLTKVVPDETAVIQIRLHGSTITSATGGESYLSTVEFDENTVWAN